MTASRTPSQSWAVQLKQATAAALLLLSITDDAARAQQANPAEMATFNSLLKMSFEGIDAIIQLGDMQSAYKICVRAWQDANQSLSDQNMVHLVAANASFCVAVAMDMGQFSDASGDRCAYYTTSDYHAREALAGLHPEFDALRPKLESQLQTLAGEMQAAGCASAANASPVLPPGTASAPPPPAETSPPAVAPPPNSAETAVRDVQSHMDFAAAAAKASPREAYDTCNTISLEAATAITDKSALAFIYAGTSVCMARATSFGGFTGGSGDRCQYAHLAFHNAAYALKYWRDAPADLQGQLQNWKAESEQDIALWQCAASTLPPIR